MRGQNLGPHAACLDFGKFKFFIDSFFFIKIGFSDIHALYCVLAGRLDDSTVSRDLMIRLL